MKTYDYTFEGSQDGVNAKGTGEVVCPDSTSIIGVMLAVHEDLKRQFPGMRIIKTRAKLRKDKERFTSTIPRRKR